ncbi:polysaccharide deacetylase family protein [Phenylobacterium sp.]|uniref:polysaccharide deacetylase family protein n=1 Tax=Phenylobacterium sp. TaxID=1871053 RepID=UPI0035B0CC26
MKAWIALTAALLATPAAAQDVALTFDDLPVHADLPAGETRLGVLARIVGALADAGAPPSYGFINGGGQAERGGAEALRVWRAAGHPVGNHTWSHQRLTEAAGFEAEVVRNEATLKALGGDWRWFRYPFLDEGATPQLRTAARRILAARGYRVASVTLTFDDWAWNGAYARCLAKGDTAEVARLEAGFLAAADDSLTRAKAMSRQLYGREIPLVLLMHVGAFDARMLPRLLALYRERGVRLVSLPEAMADPFYKDELKAAGTPAPATLEDAFAARGLAAPPTTWSAAALEPVCG